jgi:hypothetical protein
MNIDEARVRGDLTRFRRLLPLTAYPRPPLLATLRAKGLVSRASPRLLILDIFDGGEAFGLLCRFSLVESRERDFVGPFRHLSLAPARPPAESRRRFEGASYEAT